ncbi:hypothetical protein [Rhizobium sp. CECT 9324]|uniref:hypothetical protein n=1 Tax=Rhizobium sp. CECT 9324 TaxID=2845820 RepID=UPI001E656449|nr:hypothetical protein [Rhizobium sp. CECT 9324]CAH0339111.1 hypothetical protein RHI9324_00751 [Rhizobium sp. CECT 9324]
MTCLLRRALLVSSTAIVALTILPVLGAVLPSPYASMIVSVAEARGGDDDGSDDSGRDGSDDSSSSRGGSDRDSDDDRDDDRSGRRGGDDDSRDDDRDDDHGRHHSSDDNDDRDDDDSADRGRGRGRDDVRLVVSDAQLNGLRNGTMMAVDQNGNRLRYEVELEHGQTEIKLRAPKGTLTKVTVIPAS